MMRKIPGTLWPLVSALLLAPSVARSQSADPAAIAELRRALDAIGGRAVVDQVNAMRLTGYVTTDRVGDSEWPKGPFLRFAARTTELRDLARGRRRILHMGLGFVDTPPDTTVQIDDGSRLYTVSPDGQVLFAARSEGEWRDMDPTRIITTAMNAPDVHLGRDTVMRDLPQRVVEFTWRGHAARLFLDAASAYPRMIELTRTYPYEIFWNAWGDVTERIRFSMYYGESNGMRFPRQWDVERNGRPVATYVWTAVDPDPAVPADSFAMGEPSDPAATARARLVEADSIHLGNPVAIEDGLVQIQGSWNVTLVRQRDGVVVIEAPISTGYSVRVLEEAARRFPGVPIKAVITSNNFWWHMAGLREYAARGVPIYALDANEGIVRAILSAPHHERPDSLARSGAVPRLRVVREPTLVGAPDDPHRIEVVPFRTEGLDHMMLSWLPVPRLVYTAEAVQIYGGEAFFPQTIVEAAEAIRREGLDPERLIGMHLPVMPYADALSAAGIRDEGTAGPGRR